MKRGIKLSFKRNILLIAVVLLLAMPQVFAYRSSYYSNYVAPNTLVGASTGEVIYPDGPTISQLRRNYETQGLNRVNVTCRYNCNNFNRQFTNTSGYVYNTPYYGRSNTNAGNYVSFNTNSRTHYGGVTNRTAGVVQYNSNPWKFYRDYTVKTIPTTRGYEVQINGRPWYERTGIAIENTARSLWYRVTGRDMSKVNPYQ